MNDSFDEFSFLELRHRIVTAFEFLAGQSVPILERWNRAVAIDRLAGRGGLGPGD